LHQHEEKHSKHADLSNVAHNIVSIIPHSVGVEASYSHGRDVIGWRQSKTTGQTLREKIIVRQFACNNNAILAGNCAALDTAETENDLKLKKETVEKILPKMAKVHHPLGMRQGSQNLCATQKESRAQNKKMSAVRYILDTKEITKAFWSNLQHDGAAAFKFTE
jgi:hypothetical protein